MNQTFQFTIVTLAKDRFMVWASSVTMTFNLAEQMFQMNNCAKLFWNTCINVKVKARQAQFRTILSFDLQVWAWQSKYLNKCFKSHFYSSRRTNVPNNLKSMHKCRSSGLDKLYSWSFYHLTLKWDLDLRPNWTNVSNGTYTPQGEILMKSMHKYRSSGPDKLNLWPFLSFDLQVWPWPSTYQNKWFKWFFYSSRKKLPIIWNPCINIEVIWHFYSSRTTIVPNYFEIHT